MEVRVVAAACFYVYVHRRKTDGSIFYVGKGSGRRAFRRVGRNPHWASVVAKHGYDVEFVRRDISETEAFELERELIAKHGRDNLCNLTDGGEGPSGTKMSPQHKAILVAYHKGAKRPPEWRAAMSASLKGQVRPQEMRDRISAKLKGQRLSQETRAKMSAARIGRKYSAQHRANMRKAWADPEAKARRRIAMQHDGTSVICLETGERFEKISLALDWLRHLHPKASHSCIVRACKDQSKTAYGYHWTYANPGP